MRSKRIKKLNSKKVALQISLVLIALFLILISVVLFKTYSSKNVTYEGIYVENINVSNLNEKDLKEKLNEHYSDLLNNFKITFNYKDNFNETFSAKDLGFFFDINNLSNQVFSFGKNSNIFSNTIERLNLKSNPKYFQFKPQSNSEVLSEKLSEISNKINKEKVEPTISFSNDSISATKEQIGYKLDLEKLTSEIVNDLNNSHDSLNCTINIPVEEIKPKLTQETVNNMVILGSYTTKLPSLTGGRTKNISNYLSKLNGTILMPGDIFSADKEGEDRTESNGYTYAPGYIGNKVVDILAGGICQGVTTLYNSVLYADLKIVERAPHSLPVTYAPIGRDATMASGVIDFKFQNNMNNPVIVQTYITSSGQVKSNIWGIKEDPGKEIVISVDQHGPKSSTTYKETYENGVLVKKEVLSKDKYN
ncbi:VanW family protein [Clostridium perfringens]|uniref:VanW family protein n=1 Tax=Clostridium perfringens TaxID=1502 RepID=UPI001C84C891|nr:VanW family protein [Clostridium perfringens]MDK0573869.1 VanW family protein [Clostridium perfringens]